MSGFEDFDSAPEQLTMGDRIRRYRSATRASAKRVTVKELAYDLNLAPESVHNQLRDWNARKQPSADAVFTLLDKDEQYVAEIAEIRGYVLVRPPTLTPEEALRIAAEKASSKGYVSSDELARLLSQTGAPGATPHQAAAADVTLVMPAGAPLKAVR